MRNGVRVAIFVLLLAGALQAQTITGTIQGVVSDKSGAVLPGVTIRVTNLGTNQSREVLSNETGNYFVPLLAVGKYEVSAELSGFKTEVKTGMELQVEQKLNLAFVLEVGQMSEKLVVMESAPLVQADTATVGNVVDSQRIVELPLNGRRFSQVALLVPAATTLAAGNLMARPERDSFSVAGLPNTANYYMIDGIDNNDISINIAAAKPSIDSIREYKIQSGTYSAEFGHGGGAQVNVITKSGANEFHGTAYEFLRNSAMDARNYFDRADEKIPALNRHQYGGTIGGPIRRNKTFFFGSYEGLRLRQGITRGALTPSAAMKRGDFSELLQANNILGAAPIVVRDPFNNNAAFPGNIIPADRFDPSGAAIANLYPDPNRSGIGLNYISSPLDRYTWHQPSIRVDHNFSDKDTLFVRLNYNRLQTNIAFDPGTSDLPGYGKHSLTVANNIGLVETHIFSPTLINDARLGYNYFHEAQPNENSGFDATEQLLGIKGTSRDPIDFAYPYFQVTGFVSAGDRTASPQDRRVHTYQAYDAITWIRGNHNVKFGAELRRIQNNFNHHSTRRGSFLFSGRYSNAALADVLLGIPARTSLNAGDSQRYFRQWSIGNFIQDDWKVTPRLTVNIGLRYEVNTPPVEMHDKVSNFNTETGQIEIAGHDGVPRGVYRTDRNNLGPRLGLAYNLTSNGKTIVRAGYGVYYDQAADWTSVLTGSASGYPFVQSFQFNASTTAPDISLRNPFPTNSATATLSLFSEDKHYRVGYVQQYSFGLQREIARDLVVELSYLGNKATKLNIARQINQPAPGPGNAAQVNARRPYPQYGSLTQQQSSANSNYNAGIVRIEKRFANGLTFLSSYTLSKAIQDQASPNMLNNRQGRGPADINNRQRLVFSYVYRLPLATERKFIGGWQVAGVLTMRSGQSFTPVLTADVSNTTTRLDRPNRIGDPHKDDPDPRSGWWNRNAFVTPELYTFGNSGTGILVGPDLKNLDFSLTKNFRVSESQSFDFRAEVFNIMNHPNFGSPNTQWDTALFGVVTSALDSRQVQLGLKFIF
jgi:hypothetical protein